MIPIFLHAEDGFPLFSEDGFQLIAEQGLSDLIELPVLDTRHARRDPVLVSPYRLTPCPVPKVFTSRRAFTARCPTGKSGLPVSVTAIADSIVSQADADRRALAAAKSATQGRLECRYRAVASATGICGHDSTVEAFSEISQADADLKAAAAARAAANAWCMEFQPFTSTRSFTATANCPEGLTGAETTATRTAMATALSQAEADALALEQATAEATAAARAALSCVEVAYTATATVTAECGVGFSGSPATRSATRVSTASQDAANIAALAAATAAANASLVCTPVRYTATATVTVSCPEGTTGADQTYTAPGTSVVSQEDAYAQAQASAAAIASANLFCVPNTWSAEAEYTASCPDGSHGDPVTATGAATSTVSQADADAAALAQAQSNATSMLVCVPD